MGKEETYLSFVIITAMVSVVMATGSIATIRSVPTWYATLKKPQWTPPGWVFGPVWVVLYLMMAIAAWLVYLNGGFTANKFPLTMFAVQLILNGAWSPLFFTAHMPRLALVDIILLIAAVAVTMVAFWAVQPVAGMLMVPYLMWILFAAVLNYILWKMNW